MRSQKDEEWKRAQASTFSVLSAGVYTAHLKGGTFWSCFYAGVSLKTPELHIKTLFSTLEGFFFSYHCLLGLLSVFQLLKDSGTLKNVQISGWHFLSRTFWTSRETKESQQEMVSICLYACWMCGKLHISASSQIIIVLMCFLHYWPLTFFFCFQRRL